jgi:hypothetical protein
MPLMKENMLKEKKLSRLLIRRLVTKFEKTWTVCDRHVDMAIREDQGLQELMILSVKWRL